ncbi:GPO family capsid scaffolding protein [Vibrio crassostreae]|uniref:GPO family capsid scaffolding protein n=1 Tax=Vibrio crassostreae TaxID=246167 RepID=UPI001B30644D|nr:GPO family capsid scaffolding protein [Vibrio crassostreae]
MPKISEWKIIATEGPTVDGRKITRDWIEQMAASYSMDEYTALIWPEHRRFYGYGENWGRVVEVKAEELNGKLRLFAKLEPNDYMLEANRRKQKLFTSIEPNPDYKGEGRCYLMGLAATDSPASTGTSRLQFSRIKGETTEIQASHLEEVDFSDCFTHKDRFFAAFNEFFSSGDEEPETPSKVEDTDVTEEQLKAALEEHFSAFKGEFKKDLKEAFNLQESPEQPEEASQATVEQFSAMLEEKLAPFIEKVNDIETKFAELSQEVPNQEPDPSGASEKFSSEEII